MAAPGFTPHFRPRASGSVSTVSPVSCVRVRSNQDGQEVAGHHGFGASVSGRAEHAQSSVCGGAPQPGLGGRHHVYCDTRGLALSRRGAGSLFAPGYCLGNGEPPDSGVGHGGAHHGRGTPRSGEWRVASYGPRVSQYAATLYRELLASHGLTASMSRRGNCWDNAVVESFFHTLKTELVYHRRYLTREEARQDIFEWIEVFYNRTRRHSTLGYRSPAEFEAMGMGS